MAVAISLFSMKSEVGPRCPKGDELTVRLPDPGSGRQYEIYVSLPADYAKNSNTSYPLVIIADGGRAFPKLKCDARALENRKAIRQSIIVGLSYALGDDLQDSRRRDYTPTALPKGGKLYGGAAAYQRYLREIVLRYVEDNYRVTSKHRIFWGHSYGGLFGAHILLTEPSLFQTYVLGSPSFWFANEAIYDLEARYAETNRQLSATVFLYVGGLETERYDATRKGRTRDMVSGLRKFEERLQARGYEGLRISSTVIAGKDHISSVRSGFGWAMKAALPD